LFHVSKENVVSINKKNSHATPTPVIDAGKLYVHFGHLGTACLDLQGNVIWKNDTIKYPPVHGGACSPVIAGDKLFFSCDGARNAFVIALNRGTGKVAWRKLRNMNGKRQFSFCTPLVIELDGKQQIVSPGSDAVIAYEPASGREIWKVRYPDGYSVVPRPVYGHGLVYVCTGFGQASLFAIKPDGSGDVTDSHVVWKTNRSVPHTPSLLLVDEEIYMVSDNGIATCRNAKTGEEIWKERLGGKYSSSPIFAAGRAYFLSEDGKTVVMQLGKSHKIIATNELKERSLASFAVDGDSLFIRTEKNLYKIGR
jgi:outer membrane protein assembly factor BamB